MNKADFNNSMRAETFDLVNLSKQLFEDNNRDLRMALTTPELFAPRRVILTGCGDSYCAGVAAKPVFEELSYLYTSAMPAIDLARHYSAKELGNAPSNPLVVAVSVSGGVGRVIEACRRANEAGVGSLTVAVTGNPESPLAKECKKIMHVKTPAFDSGFPEHTPGTRSYYASMFALMMLGIRIGEVKQRYTMEQGNDYRKSTVEYAQSFAPVMESIDDQMFEIAKKWKDLQSFEFVASGTDLATAWFGSAKVYEASGDIATYENIEDWSHVNYFAQNPSGIGTVLIISKDSPALERAIKTAQTMALIGRPSLVVTDADRNLFPKELDVCVIPSPKYSWATPLMQYVPITLLTGYIAKLKGVNLFRYGDNGHWSQKDGSRIKSSKIEVVL